MFFADKEGCNIFKETVFLIYSFYRIGSINLSGSPINFSSLRRPLKTDDVKAIGLKSRGLSSQLYRLGWVGLSGTCIITKIRLDFFANEFERRRDVRLVRRKSGTDHSLEILGTISLQN